MELILEDEIKICGVYEIRNVVNNKVYIGSTKNIKQRFYKHNKLLKSNMHDNLHLMNAYKKYGFKSFKMKMLEFCLEINLLETEQKYLNMYWDHNINDFDRTLCYNIAKIANKPPTYSGSNHPMYGKKGSLSPLYGRPVSEIIREKIKQANIGRKHSSKTKKLISQNHANFKGKNHPMYGKKGSLSPLYGSKHSNETKQKIRETKLGIKNPMYGKTPWNKGIPCSIELKEKISKKHAKVWNIILISPGGNEYIIESNITKFCKEHDLSSGNIIHMIKGNRKSHKGWKLKNV